MTTTGAPAGRYFHTAVWTGANAGMVVFGGFDNTSSGVYGNGGRFNPGTNGWGAMSTTFAPAGRAEAVSVWTGTEVIVWSGFNYANGMSDGGRYNVVNDQWQPMTLENAPEQRDGPLAAVWDGTEMLIFGGGGWTQCYYDMFAYRPSRVMYLYLRP